LDKINLHMINGQFRLNVRTHAGENIRTLATPQNESFSGQWVFVEAIVDLVQNSMTIRVNGEVKAFSDGLNFGRSTFSNEIGDVHRIGRISSTYFAGLMDEVRLWLIDPGTETMHQRITKA